VTAELSLPSHGAIHNNFYETMVGFKERRFLQRGGVVLVKKYRPPTHDRRERRLFGVPPENVYRRTHSPQAIDALRVEMYFGF